MSNVVHLNVPPRLLDKDARLGALLATFAQHRRAEDDVFWLKENAEILNVLEVTGAAPGAEALSALGVFYETVESRLAFFPQYYRFILSMALDLEDLGLPGTKGEALCHQARKAGYAEAELSDLQRMEARRLMARRGIRALPQDGGLEDRLRGFADRSATFAVPNKKAAYELTHIVFYLSDYGRRDPGISDAAVTSLIYAGTIAFLDKNADLLSEVAIALSYSGVSVPQPWAEWLAISLGAMRVTGDADLRKPDDYHEYLVANWCAASLGHAPFEGPIYSGPMRFDRMRGGASPLREISEALFLLGANRAAEWSDMRSRVPALLSDAGLDALEAAAAATPCHFEGFFAHFARAEGRCGAVGAT